MSIDYALGDDHVVTITINRPEARNSMDMEHFFQLRTAWDRFGEDDDAYVAIVTGVGKDFCVGADLKTYIPQITELQSKMKAGQHPDELGGYRLDDGVKAVLRGTKLYKPIIAAVNGVCVAGGMEMLGGTDLRVASDTATFGVMEPKRGLFAGGGTTVRLPRQIPWPAAMELLLCADQVPAQRAYEMGLLNEVWRPADLMARAYDYAYRITANGPSPSARPSNRRCAGWPPTCGRPTRSSRRSRARSSAARTPRRGPRRSPRSGRRSGRTAEAWLTGASPIDNARLQGGQIGIHLDEAGLEASLGLGAHQHRRHIGLVGDRLGPAVTEVVEDDCGHHAALDFSFCERQHARWIELDEHTTHRVLLPRFVADHHRFEATAGMGLDRDPR